MMQRKTIWHLIVAALAYLQFSGQVRAEMKPGSEFKECDVCPTMVVIPPGKFLMGSPQSEPGHQPEEAPQYEVTIPAAFAVGKLEILRNEYAVFVRETSRKMDGCWVFGPDGGMPENKKNLSFLAPGFEQNDNHPVTCVSWEDAKAYTEWLSKKAGATYRLLTEAEWEYAARAGSQSRYSFGDDPAQLCKAGNGADADARKQLPTKWTFYDCSDGHVHTAPSGSFAPNAFGLYDMIGNIWEWVEDCYSENYVGAPKNGAARTKRNCTERVLRGGSWSHDAPYLRSAFRCGMDSIRYNQAGFRVAKTLLSE